MSWSEWKKFGGSILLHIKTLTTSGSDNRLSVDIYSGTDEDKKLIITSIIGATAMTLPITTDYFELAYVSLRYTLKAKTNVVCDGVEYTAGQTIKDWSFTESVDFKIIANL